MSYMTIPIGDFPSGAYQGGYGATNVPNSIRTATEIAFMQEEQRKSIEAKMAMLQRAREAMKGRYFIVVSDEEPTTYSLMVKNPLATWGSENIFLIADKLTLEEARDMKIALMVADKMAPEPTPEPEPYPVNPAWVTAQPLAPMPQITYWTNSDDIHGLNS